MLTVGETASFLGPRSAWGNARIELWAADFLDVLAVMAVEDLLVRNADGEGSDRIRLVLRNQAGEIRSVFAPYEKQSPSFERCQLAIVELADPVRRGIEPLWSRGQYLPSHPPFP
jgi:hypothetical protein